MLVGCATSPRYPRAVTSQSVYPYGYNRPYAYYGYGPRYWGSEEALQQRQEWEEHRDEQREHERSGVERLETSRQEQHEEKHEHGDD